MGKKVICFVAFSALLSLVGIVTAAEWTDAGIDNLWSTPDNWDTAAVPTANDTANIGGVPGALIDGEAAVVMNMQIGKDGHPEESVLTIDAGSLTISQYLLLAGSAGAATERLATLTINGGSVTMGRLDVAHTGQGIVNVNGGSLTVTGPTTVAGKAQSTGHINLSGGVMNVNNLLMRDVTGAVGTIDVKAGMLVQNGDTVSALQDHISKGWITAYDGQGELILDYDVTHEGRTTLTAVHNLLPSPADGGIVAPGAVELSWTLPDPCVPGELVTVDVYYTDDYDAIWNFTDPEAIQVVKDRNVSSVAVQAQEKVTYYWAVDTYIGDPNDPILGPIFSFTADNLAPQVDAGAGVVTWLVDGVRTGTLDGSVTDSGAYTVQWSVVSEPDDPDSPDAVITDPRAEDTSIVLSALGEYVFQLAAFDGEKTGSDTVTINVYNNSCEATQSLPGYEPLVGDLNGDCKVDALDQALLEENLGQDISITDEWYQVD